MDAQTQPLKPALLVLSEVRFAWPQAGQATLHIPHWEVQTGERIFLHGPSGCGKSTLLSLIGGVLTPQSGRVRFMGQDTGQLSASQRDRFRGEHMGFIFQQFNLLPWLSGLDNVLLAVEWSPRRRARLGADARQVAQELLSSLGLSASEWLRPAGQLSVGQQQRVAAARALLGQPELILADEPTSALDAAHQDRFVQLLEEACTIHGSTLIFVSHDERLSRHFDRRVSLPGLQASGLVQEPA